MFAFAKVPQANFDSATTFASALGALARVSGESLDNHLDAAADMTLLRCNAPGATLRFDAASWLRESGFGLVARYDSMGSFSLFFKLPTDFAPYESAWARLEKNELGDACDSTQPGSCQRL